MAALDPTAWLGAGIVIGWLFTWMVLRGKAADAYRHALAAAPGRRLSLAGLKAATAP